MIYDAVINAFDDMYRNASGEFPSGVSERDYLDRMRAAYPIHPEMFDRLYQEIGRSRGHSRSMVMCRP
jgi:predicted AAA+ superfamily ATPase